MQRFTPKACTSSALQVVTDRRVQFVRTGRHFPVRIHRRLSSHLYRNYEVPEMTLQIQQPATEKTPAVLTDEQRRRVSNALAAIRATAFTPGGWRGGSLESEITTMKRGRLDIALTSVPSDVGLRVSEAA